MHEARCAVVILWLFGFNDTHLVTQLLFERMLASNSWLGSIMGLVGKFSVPAGFSTSHFVRRGSACVLYWSSVEQTNLSGLLLSRLQRAAGASCVRCDGLQGLPEPIVSDAAKCKS